MRTAFKSPVHVTMTLTLLSAALLYAGPKGPNYDDLRSMAMGNTTVAVTTDRTAIFHNPAGLGLLRDDLELSITPIGMFVDGRVISTIGELLEHQDNLSDFDNINDDVVSSIQEIDGQRVSLGYIPEISVAKKNLGFGMYSVVPVGFRVESGHFIPKLAFAAQQDLVFTWAVGVPLKQENHHFGISVEYLQRKVLDERITSYTETYLLAGDLADRPFGIIGDLTETQHGTSFDIGFMHDWEGFRLAWDVKDIFGVVAGKLIFPPQFDLGGAYFFPQVDDIDWIRNLIVSLEFSDLVGFEERDGKYEDFRKKIHLGAEFDVKYAALRVGLNQGYPTVGLGLSFGLVNVDYAFFTEEGGLYPGQLPIRKHAVTMSFGFRINQAVMPENMSSEGIREVDGDEKTSVSLR